MNRKDFHRSAESDWRATQQPTNRNQWTKKPTPAFRLITFLKVVAVIVVLALVWETAPQRNLNICKGTGKVATSNFCKE